MYDSDENIYRPAEYRDIVILTRSVTGWADTFADALMDRGDTGVYRFVNRIFQRA